MVHNEQLINRIRIALADFEDVEEKTMFNGVTFMLNGKMCVGAKTDEMMCRIDPALHDQVIEEPGCREMVHGGRVMKGFVFVAENVLKTKKQFDRWMMMAIEYNKIAKAAPKKKGKK